MSSSMALTRPMIRQSGSLGRMAARRFESSNTSKAAESAKEAASKVSASASEYAAKAQQSLSKAQEGLSKVTSAAGPAISNATKAAKGLATSLSKAGGRTGQVVGFIERQIPHIVYFSKVGLELGKIVFRGQKMSPPFQKYWQGALKSAQNPNALLQTASQTASKFTQQPSSIIQQAKNLNRAQLVAGGVVAAECLGFFTVGEMIGRFKIVGYHGGSGAAHH